MSTSAGALSRLLSTASHYSDPKEKFSKVIADRLGLEGDDQEVKAMIRVQALVNRVHEDIDRLEFEDNRKLRLRKFMQPFNGLHNFSQAHLNIANANNNFLKAENLTGLMNVDDALSGYFDYSDFDAKTKKFAAKLRELKAEFELVVDAPERLQRTVSARLSQIASMLENLHVFGADALQEELEALVGAIVVNPPSKTSKAYKVCKKIGIVSVAIFLALPSVDASLGAAKSLTTQANKFIESITDEDNSN